MAKTRKLRNKSKKHKKRTYTKKHYQSGDGMVTSVWGPPLWHYLHTMSFNYPVKPTPADKRNYKNFILSLRHVLPCRYCRENLTKNLKVRVKNLLSLLILHNQGCRKLRKSSSQSGQCISKFTSLVKIPLAKKTIYQKYENIFFY